MKRLFMLFVLSAISVLLLSCGKTVMKTVIKKPAAFNNKIYSGKAVISELSNPDSSGYVKIYFNFIPSDVNASGEYLCQSCTDKKIRLKYDNRDNFHSNWIKLWDIRAGNEYFAERIEHPVDDKTVDVYHDVQLKPAGIDQDK